MPVLWAANGLFQAMVWPPIVRLFAECMPFEQQDSACVSINSTTPAGTLGAYALSAAALALAGWRMAFWTCGALMLALASLLALPIAVKASLPASLVLLAATTALMLGVNTMFINVMPVKIGREQRRGRPLRQPERHHLPGGGHRHLGHRRGGRGLRLGGGVRPLGRDGRDGAGRLPAAGPALGPLCPGM